MDLQKGRAFTDIQKEIEISEHQPVKFITDTELRELYSAMAQHWQLDLGSETHCLAASIFYNLGRVHGIREERARRKAV